FELARVEHRAATEAFPHHTDIAARHGDQHMRGKDDADQGEHHQVDDENRHVIFEKAPPPAAAPGCRWDSVRGPEIRFHAPCSTAARSTKRPSSIRSLRAGKSSSSR